MAKQSFTPKQRDIMEKIASFGGVFVEFCDGRTINALENRGLVFITWDYDCGNPEGDRVAEFTATGRQQAEVHGIEEVWP